MSEKLQQASPNTVLRDRRKQRQWTQADVAELLDVTELTVRRWERGQSRPSSYYVQKLCILFEANAEELGLLRATPPAELPPAARLTDPFTHNIPEEHQKTQESLSPPIFINVQETQESLPSTNQLNMQHTDTNPFPTHLHRPFTHKRHIYLSLALLVVTFIGFAGYILGQHFVFHAGVASSVRSTVAKPSQRLLYQADWSKNAAGWTVTPHWHWSHQDGGMFSTDSMTNSVAIAPYHPATLNYAVEARIQRVSYSNINGNAFGLVIMQTPTDGYVDGVGVHKTPEHFFIGQLTVSKGNKNPYISADIATASSNIDNSWHNYRMEVHTNYIISYVDGKQSIVGNDYTHVAAGQVGIYVAGALIRIEHFSVYTI